MVALASTEAHPAGIIVRSDDGGLNWSQFETPLPDAIEGLDEELALSPGTGLVAAGSWLVAFRSVAFAGNRELFGEQAVAVSHDLGATWQLVDLPAPTGSEPFVWTATEVDGRLVLGGATQVVLDLPDQGYDSVEGLEQAYDAAFWVSGDPVAGFERLAAAQFDGTPDAQRISELVVFDGRLIALGGETGDPCPQTSISSPERCPPLKLPRVAWESRDGGVSWSPMNGLPLDNPRFRADVGYRGVRPSMIIDGSLVTRTGGPLVALAPGSSNWVPTPLFGSMPDGDGVALTDDSAALTWNEDNACDCSIAYAGRAEDGGVVAQTELAFDDCRDQSPRGGTRSRAPGLIGGLVGGLASCDDLGSQVASLAYTLDGGTSWETARLGDFAPDGSDLVGVPAFLFLPEQGGVLIALLSVLGSDSRDGARIAALRIEAIA